jgi:hypothetical protein
VAKMTPADPAWWMMEDDFTSTPVKGLYRDNCYICRDPEFAQMGLPLCYACTECGGHVAADDTVCDDCSVDAQEIYYAAMKKKQDECGEATGHYLAVRLGSLIAGRDGVERPLYWKDPKEGTPQCIVCEYHPGDWVTHE